MLNTCLFQLQQLLVLFHFLHLVVGVLRQDQTFLQSLQDKLVIKKIKKKENKEKKKKKSKIN